MSITNRRLTTLGALLAGMAGAFLLLAGPAAAQTTSQTSGGAVATGGSVGSGTCTAVSSSVCSGSGVATNGSTSSGSAVAANGSVASGCATATNLSTASGGPCPPTTTVIQVPGVPSLAGSTPARPATATSGSLALTGSDSGTLAGIGALALLAGAALVRAGRWGTAAGRA
jgi:hypothetical protein